MRSLFFLTAALCLVGCSATDDSAVTDDNNELNEGVGSLERALSPQVAAPKNDAIGAKTSEVLANAIGTATGATKKGKDGCSTTTYKDAETDKVIVRDIVCSKSETIEVLDADGKVSEEHADLDKDGKVDRYSSESGVIAQLLDTNYNGKIDVVIERVSKLKDFSMEGYDVVYPKSRFLYRIREDRNRDGKMDWERLTAKGILPKSE
jgi:hypothetical protein